MACTCARRTGNRLRTTFVVLLAFLMGSSGCDNIFDVEHVGTRDGRDAGLDVGLDDDAAPDPLVAWYPMDTLSGGVLVDEVNGLDGMCGQCPSPVAGRLGGGLAFDGSTTRLLVSPDPLLETTDGYTVALWFRFPTGDASGCNVSKPYGATFHNTWQVCIDELGRLGFGSFDGTNRLFLNVGTVADVSWHHLAMLSNGAQISVALDGIVTDIGPGSPAFDMSGIVIGGDYDSAVFAYAWRGELDDLRIYNRALSGDELVQLAAP